MKIETVGMNDELERHEAIRDLIASAENMYLHMVAQGIMTESDKVSRARVIERAKALTGYEVDAGPTYIVWSPGGELMGKGVTAEEAAMSVLQYDGARYEIRKWVLGEVPVWAIWSKEPYDKTYVGPLFLGPHPAPVISAPGRTAEEAWPELAKKVIAACVNWRGAPQVMTMDEYEHALAMEAAEIRDIERRELD